MIPEFNLWKEYTLKFCGTLNHFVQNINFDLFFIKAKEHPPMSLQRGVHMVYKLFETHTVRFCYEECIK